MIEPNCMANDLSRIAITCIDVRSFHRLIIAWLVVMSLS
jgi:hypothetical protein